MGSALSLLQTRLAGLGTLARLALLGLGWILAVGGLTIGFVPPGVVDDWVSLDHALVFGASMLIGSLVSIATTFSLAGSAAPARRATVAGLLGIALLILTTFVVLWLDPRFIRGKMGYWEFVRVRSTMLLWGASTLRHELPEAALVGLLIGVLAGGLVRLARRRPRTVTAIVVCLIIAGATDQIRRRALQLVIWWGILVRWLIDSPGLADPYIPAAGASIGGFAGAILAAVLLWRWSRPPRARRVDIPS